MVSTEGAGDVELDFREIGDRMEIFIRLVYMKANMVASVYKDDVFALYVMFPDILSLNLEQRLGMILETLTDMDEWIRIDGKED